MQLPTNEKDLQKCVKLYKHFAERHSPESRISQIKYYLDKWRIKDVVLGVSGGVDSALVLAMLSSIPEIRVHAVTIDFDIYKDVWKKAYVSDLKKAFSDRKNIEWTDSDMTGGHARLMSEIGIGHTSSDVYANTTYALRYFALFAIAQHYGGITFGTTNLDECGYVGWFGKNSDMVVDIQPIADLHKFEVVAWAEILGVPESITQRKPTGDLLDGSSDEENFGCTYDELSYLTHIMQKKVVLNDFLKARFSKAIALHEKNAHKYQGQRFNPIFF